MTEIEMSLFEALRTFKQSFDQLLNGENVATDPDTLRKWGFVLMLFPYHDRSGGCSVVSNGVPKDDIMGIFRHQLDAYARELHVTERQGQDHKPFDPAANMIKMNRIMHQYRDGEITREVCKQRLMDECKVADYNLDQLLNAYDPKEQQDNDTAG
jgi:hypothetical protein